jgi:hypothetical protein
MAIELAFGTTELCSLLTAVPAGSEISVRLACGGVHNATPFPAVRGAICLWC